MALDTDAVQARLGLISYLYKESLKGTSEALALTQQPPLTAEEKEVLFAEVEKAVWALDDDVFKNAPEAPEGWADRAEDLDPVKGSLETAVSRVLQDRKGAARQ